MSIVANRLAMRPMVLRLSTAAEPMTPVPRSVHKADSLHRYSAADLVENDISSSDSLQQELCGTMRPITS